MRIIWRTEENILQIFENEEERLDNRMTKSILFSVNFIAIFPNFKENR